MQSTTAALSTVPLLLSLACSDSIDRAAVREHELIDHEYDRQEQLVDRIFVHIDEVMARQQDHQTDLVDRFFDEQAKLFELVLTAEPPPGFGHHAHAGYDEDTCSFTTEPAGAELYMRNIFDEWEYVGRTPIVVDRPLAHARPIELRAQGYRSAHGYMLSDEVHQPCREHFVLGPS